MLFFDVDVALSEVPVNAVGLTDDTDFKSLETAVAYNASGLTLYWHFVTPNGNYTVTQVTPTTGGVYDWAHQQQAFYSIEIPASGGGSINNDTEGIGWFTGVATGVLPWRGPFCVFRAAGLNDLLIENAYSTTRGLTGTAVPAVAAEASGGLFTRGSGAGQIAQDANGRISVNLIAILGTTLTETAGQIAAAFKKWFDVPTPVGTVNSIPNATAGATGGLAIVGSQMDLKDSPNATAITAINAAVLTAISNLNNLSALANLYGSPLLEIPDSSSTPFAFTLVVRDNEGKLVDLDASPTIAAANAGGTDRSANLSAVSHPATGRYTFTYTVSSAAAEESLRITCSGAVSAESRYIEWIGAVVNYDSLTLINAIKTKTDNLPSDPADQSQVEAAITTAVATIRGVDNDTLKTLSDAIDAKAEPGDQMDLVNAPNATAVSALQSGLATAANLASLAGKFTGITALADWLRCLARSDTTFAGRSTALTEINTGTSNGDFNNSSHSEEALADAIDEIEGGGGGGGGGTTNFVVHVMASVVSAGEVTEGVLIAYERSSRTYAIPVVDQDGEAIPLPDADELVFVVEHEKGRADLFVIDGADSGITVEDNVAYVTCTSEQLTPTGSYRFALRTNDETEFLWAHGTMPIRRAAFSDAE